MIIKFIIKNFVCNRCRNKFRAKYNENLGNTVKCPRCKKTLGK